MKILLIDNSSLTLKNDRLFCETKTGQFSEELKSLGNEVTMYGQIVRNKNNIHAFDLKYHSIRTIGIMRKRNKIINYLVLYSLIIPRIIEADFVYIFYPSAFKYVSALCWLLNKPYGIYIRGEKGIQSKSSKWIYRKSKVVFTVTDYFTKMVSNLTSSNSAYTIRPMIPLTQNDIIYNRNYATPKHYEILFLARIELDKGIKELLEALNKLKKEKYLFTINLVGDGSYLPQARELIRKLDIDDIVIVKGIILDSSEIKQLYLNADLYVLPSHHEGFPRTLYEAMIFGTPIITTFVGGIPSIMIDKHNCLKIELKSVDSIVEAIKYSMSHYPEMKNLAKNGLETVKPIVDSFRPSHAEHLNNIINTL